jgi:lambda repressor-like predicted transcriptional regulator
MERLAAAQSGKPVVTRTEFPVTGGFLKQEGSSIAADRCAKVLPILRELGISRAKWAFRAGVDPSVVYDYLKGTSNPRPESRKVLAEAIGLTAAELPE